MKFINGFLCSFIIVIVPVIYADMLDILYKTRLGSAMRPLVTNVWVNIFVGRGADSRLSKVLVRPFIKGYNINMHEALYEDPQAYRTLNDIFARKLKPSARPIAMHPQVSAPADGVLYVMNNVQRSNQFMVKGVSFDLAEFVGDEQLAQQFYGGTVMVIYLAPSDYHRFHAPFDALVEGTPVRIRGTYESVNPKIFDILQPLARNERQLILLREKQSQQKVLMVPVGAMFVGSIKVTYTDNMLKQGDEMGYFKFGGSTVVLVFPPHFIDPVEVTSLTHPIKMGQSIGTVAFPLT